MHRSNQPDIKSLTIREARPEDTPILDRLFPSSDASFHKRRIDLQNERGAIYLLAILHGKPVAYTFLLWEGINTEAFKEKYKNCPAIEDLSIDHMYRMRGIEEKLLEHCLKLIREKGHHRLAAAVDAENIQERQFYHHHGFTDAGIGFNTGSNEKESRRIFIKHL